MDTDSFASGLKAAMRQDPDVIVLGDLPDPATLEAGLRAAETGRLVISTVPAPDATHALDRLVAMYTPTEQDAARVRLIEALTAIIAQRLVPRSGGEGLAVVAEVVRGTAEVRECFHGQRGIEALRVVVADARERHGMQTFDQHLEDLVDAKVVSAEVARTIKGGGVAEGEDA